MIVVIAPMKIEKDAITACMKDSRQSDGPFEVTVGRIGKTEIAVVLCGVGLVAAAAAATFAIEKFQPIGMINVGIAGGIGLAPMTTVIPTAVVQSDMDTTAVGDPVGYLSDLKTIRLYPDAALRLALCTAAASYSEGVLASADCFVHTQEQFECLKDRFDAVCCDMEGGAVAHVCAIYRVPFALLRTISDNGGAQDFASFALAASQRAAEVLARFLENR